VLKETHTTLRDAVSSHAKAFKTLQADLAEAKHERILDPRIRGRRLKLYDAAIGSLGRLAQHLSGLRSSTRLQEGLSRAIREGRISLDLPPEKMTSSISISALGLDASFGPNGLEDIDINGSVRLFLKFREIAGMQMKDLVVSSRLKSPTNREVHCDEALDAVQALSRTETEPLLDLAGIRESLALALKEFNRSSSAAIKRLYAGPRRAKGVYEDGRDSSSDDEKDEVEELDEVADGPNEAVFLIYL
jgi:hypothetical protein